MRELFIIRVYVTRAICAVDLTHYKTQVVAARDNSQYVGAGPCEPTSCGWECSRQKADQGRMEEAEVMEDFRLTSGRNKQQVMRVMLNKWCLTIHHLVVHLGRS